jgi:hypothetical protein
MPKRPRHEGPTNEMTNAPIVRVPQQPTEPPLLAFLLAKHLRRCSEDGDLAPTEQARRGGLGAGGRKGRRRSDGTTCKGIPCYDVDAESDTTVVHEERVDATHKDGCPCHASPLPTIESLLPKPLGSLVMLEEYVRLHCTQLDERRPLVHPEGLHTPGATTVILRCLGYLGSAPLLRCLLLHHALTTRAYDRVLAVLDILRRDVRHRWMQLESLLREAILNAGSSRLMSSTITSHALLVASFTIALRADTARHVEDLKRVGPRPALVVVPSQIQVANFGLYLRGAVAKNTPIAEYAGEREDADADGRSGYRMEFRKGVVVDSMFERCLCSMMNDARFSVFENNCRFSVSRHTVRAVSKRAIENEELFVSYGAKFRFDLEGVAAGFSRSLAADLCLMANSATLPQLNTPINLGKPR